VSDLWPGRPEPGGRARTAAGGLDVLIGVDDLVSELSQLGATAATPQSPIAEAAWYKMSFFEGAARVPLIVRAPALFPPGRVPTAVSTMDLLPTLVGLAHDGDLSGIVGALDGQSLLPHLSGAPDHDEVAAEYLAEGAIAPIVMIRRGQHKFIHSP